MIEAALISALGSLVKEASEKMDKDYTDRVETARQKAEKARRDSAETGRVGTETPFTTAQDELIGTLTALSDKIEFWIRVPDLQYRLLTSIRMQTLAAYEATTLQQLKIITANVRQIQSVVEGLLRQQRNRQYIRMAAVGVSVLGLVSLCLFIFFADKAGINARSKIEILQLPVPVVLWSVIGSFASILYRFSNNGDAEITDPLRWLFSRPLTGIIMGSITYLIVRVGFLTLSPSPSSAEQAAQSLGSNELIWLIAFLAGFSDSFADRLLQSSVGRLGGSASDGLVTTPPAPLDATGRPGGLLGQLSALIHPDRPAGASEQSETPALTPATKPNRTVSLGEKAKIVSPGKRSKPAEVQQVDQ